MSQTNLKNLVYILSYELVIKCENNLSLFYLKFLLHINYWHDCDINEYDSKVFYLQMLKHYQNIVRVILKLYGSV